MSAGPGDLGRTSLDTPRTVSHGWPSVNMKRPFVAFLLSFLLPGAGLAYLGLWKWALINLLAVLVVGFLLAFLLPEEFLDRYMRYVAIGLSSGSGGLAQALAVQRNLKKGK